MTSRRFVLTSTAALIGAASTSLLLPGIARAQSGKVRVGFMLPYTGTFAQLVRSSTSKSMMNPNLQRALRTPANSCSGTRLT